jgi:hypothetical protein
MGGSGFVSIGVIMGVRQGRVQGDPVSPDPAKL